MKRKWKYNLDEYVFDVTDTEEKAYWLGYPYCDGCVSSHRTKNGDLTQLILASVDRNIIEKFPAFLKTTDRPIYESITKTVLYEGTDVYLNRKYIKYLQIKTAVKEVV